MKRYLFFAQLSYTFSILRPLEQEIWRRGDDCAWFLEDSCDNLLEPNEKRLTTIDEVIDYKPLAVFAPGNYIYDFFPGIKVQVFHGYPINKRNATHDDHFHLRGWFDLYCTQGPSSTVPFRKLEAREGYFKVYETGWCKTDDYVMALKQAAGNDIPDYKTIVYASTFSHNITSAYEMPEAIEQMAKDKPWHWLMTLHPKLTDPDLRNTYKQLARKYPEKITFKDALTPLDLAYTDAMLCDTSSIIVEYMMLGKPVVTYHNTNPGPQLVNVIDKEAIAPALERVLSYPKELMDNIQEYTDMHEAHRDGLNSTRVLDAVDDFLANSKGRIKAKPLNLFRKLKLRLRLRRWFPLT